MQAHYFLMLQGKNKAVNDPIFREEKHSLNTLWWFQGELENIAYQLGVTPLSKFISYSRTEMAYEIGEEEVERLEREGWSHDGPITLQEQWFAAEAGIKIIRTVLEHIQSHPHIFDKVQLGPQHTRLVAELITTLEALVEKLEEAHQQHTKFRFYVRY